MAHFYPGYYGYEGSFGLQYPILQYTPPQGVVAAPYHVLPSFAALQPNLPATLYPPLYLQSVETVSQRSLQPANPELPLFLQTASWSEQKNEILLQARASGLSWQTIAFQIFGGWNSPEECEKQHDFVTVKAASQKKSHPRDSTPSETTPSTPKTAPKRQNTSLNTFDSNHDRALRVAFAQQSLESVDWTQLAHDTVNGKYDAEICKKRIFEILGSRKPRSILDWTSEEDAKLKHAVSCKKIWKEIAALWFEGSRSESDCEERWESLMSPQTNPNPIIFLNQDVFLLNDIDALMEAFSKQKLETFDWNQLAADTLNGKYPVEVCKKQLLEYVRSKPRSLVGWKEAEDAKLKAAMECKKDYEEIAALWFEGTRSAQDCRNRWMNLCNPVEQGNEKKRSDPQPRKRVSSQEGLKTGPLNRKDAQKLVELVNGDPDHFDWEKASAIFHKNIHILKNTYERAKTSPITLKYKIKKKIQEVDWEWVSTTIYKSRLKADQCKAYYSVPEPVWQPLEDDWLEHVIVSTELKTKDWNAIAKIAFPHIPGRGAIVIARRFKKWMQDLVQKENRKFSIWFPADLNKLRLAVDQHKFNWPLICLKYFPEQRTASACKYTYAQKISSETSSKKESNDNYESIELSEEDEIVEATDWTLEEDKDLIKVVTKMLLEQNLNWFLVSESVFNRKYLPLECLKRAAHLDSATFSKRWTPEEEELLLNTVKKQGKKFNWIALFILPTRTPSALSSRYSKLTDQSISEKSSDVLIKMLSK